MKVPVIVLAIALFFPILAKAQTEKFDGNMLLERCGDVIKTADNPDSHVSSFNVAWCLGYIQGFRSSMTAQYAVNAKTSSDGDFEKARDKGTLGISLPANVSTGQIARVFVKWLQDHPQNLNENASFLTVIILRDAFPIQTSQK